MNMNLSHCQQELFGREFSAASNDLKIFGDCNNNI